MRCAAWVRRAAVCGTLGCAILSAQTPAPQPRFEVASIKPAANDETAGGPSARMREIMRDNRLPGAISMASPGRVNLEKLALLDLIAAAYRVRTSQVSGPVWMSDEDFDIEAKVPEGTPKEQLNAMLQSLLEERFGLKVHRDTQTEKGFALVVGKDGPKLKSAEPPPAEAQDLTPEERRAKSKEQVLARLDAMTNRMEQNQANGKLMSRFATQTWPSVTSEELAAGLVPFAEAPIVDETGLTGKYSVTIEVWESAETPGGTVFDAVEKLGLKLEPRKVSVEIVVVDQVSKSPTPN